jgi:hypothetical protein
VVSSFVRRLPFAAYLMVPSVLAASLVLQKWYSLVFVFVRRCLLAQTGPMRMMTTLLELQYHAVSTIPGNWPLLRVERVQACSTRHCCETAQYAVFALLVLQKSPLSLDWRTLMQNFLVPAGSGLKDRIALWSHILVCLEGVYIRLPSSKQSMLQNRRDVYSDLLLKTFTFGRSPEVNNHKNENRKHGVFATLMLQTLSSVTCVQLVVHLCVSLG